MVRGGPLDLERAADHLRSILPRPPEVLVVLGSGLGQVAERVEATVSVPFHEVPGMPAASVPGHAGRFLAGRLGRTDVLVQSGRYHLYEGHPPEIVAAPVRVASMLGAGILVATNAAGGVREDLEPGSLVLVEDHVNFMFRSPLVGAVLPGETRFPDMSAPYDPELRALAGRVAERRGIALAGGVYGAVLGPSFETAAEVRMLARLGVDVVGMSTVPEVIVARARGMRCLAFSMVTNHATGLSEGPLSHDEVLEVGREAGARLAELLIGVFEEMGSGSTPRSGAQPTGAK